MRPASSASFAAVRRLAKRDTLRNLSSLMVLGALPERVEVIQAAPRKRGRAATGEAFHRSEALAESHVRTAQRRFGIHAEPAREIDDAEHHIAEFVAHAIANALFDRFVQLVQLLADLVDHRIG